MTQKIRALRGLIYSKYDTEAELARALNWSRQKLSKITNGKVEPTIDELSQLAESLQVSIGDLANIFLQYRSSNRQQTAS